MVNVKDGCFDEAIKKAKKSGIRLYAIAITFLWGFGVVWGGCGCGLEGQS